MRNCLHLWLAISLLLATAISCDKTMPSGPSTGKDGNEYSDESVLKDGVLFFDQSDAKYLAVKDEDLILVKAGTPEALVPAPGVIVFAAQSSHTPFGFMGRVQDISDTDEGKEMRTEPVSLDEVFEELHIDQNLDIAEQLDNLVDEDGNSIQAETIDNSFWSQFDSGEDDVDTKADYVKEKHITKAIPLSASFFDGSLILNSDIHVKIIIEKGLIQDYSIELRAATSIEGKASISGESSKMFSKTLILPTAIWVGPIALRPAIVYGLGFTAEGNIKMDGPISIGLSSTTTRWENNSPGQTIIDKSHPVHCQATYLDCDGTLFINGRLALQFGVFGQKVLAFGIDWQPDVTIGLSGEMHMQNKKIMAKNPEATISGSFGSFGAYLYSKLFAKHLQDKLRVSVQTPTFSYIIPLFDKGEKHNYAKQTGTWGISGEYGENEVFMTVDKKGYALFRINQEEPVAIRTAPAINRAVKSDIATFHFDIPDNPFDYYVRPLNIVKGDTGKEYQFYGDIIGAYISQLQITGEHNNGETYSFSYDDYGRLTKLVKRLLGSEYYDEVLYSYFSNRITLDWKRMNVTWKDEAIGLDSKGRMVSYSGDNINRTFSYPSDGNVSVHEAIQSSEDYYYLYDRILIYQDGSLNSQNISFSSPSSSGTNWVNYSYSGHPDYYSIDFIHSLLDDLKMHTLPPFIAFPGIRNQYLLSNIGGDVTLSVSSSFDRIGRLSQFQWYDGELRTAQVEYCDL